MAQDFRADVFIGVVHHKAQAGRRAFRRDIPPLHQGDHQHGGEQRNDMNRVQVEKTLGPEGFGRLTHLVAVAIDVRQQKARQHKKGAGGKKAHAGKLC